ncbi:uncharacterized protein LOC127706754 isoform X1 [Mytilus californianus]|uniref:uncharacterized protein LOC127706754 isoform X1 n=2 Tax=Mytilus californianus TaxID=6549 RepID=UPI002247B38B|nr:uncharacterized protein LOC127706754 isoform X1 [Mytilus californianus]
MMKLLLKTIIAAETKIPSPPAEEPSPSLVSISKSDVIKPQVNRTAMGEYIVNPGEKPLTSLGNPGPGPANYNPCPNLTKESAPQYSIVGKQKVKEHGRGLPGPSDYGPSGDLIWKKQYVIKGRATCYFDEEASKYCTVIGPAKYNVRHKQFGLEGLKYSMAHKQPGDIITGPPNNIVQPSDTHVRKLSIASEPLPGQYFMNSVMDFRTSTSRTASVLDRYTSYSSMQPNHELLSPRFFAGTPAPNQYHLKSSIGLQPGTSMKGNRRRNFDRAKADCSFLLPELIDGFPSPNSYNTNKSTLGLGSGVSFKGKRGGPFQTNKGQMYIPAQYNERDKMSETYDTTSYVGKSSGVSFKGNRRRRIVMGAKNANAGFLLPNLIEASPGPGSYNIKSTIGMNNGVSFKGRKTGPFQSNRGATYINPEVNEKEMRPGHYTLASSIGNSPGVSFKGNRQRTFENAKASNALFLLPNSVNDTPAPGFYSMKSSIGSEQSVSMKGKKSGPFQSNKGPKYIPVEMNERDSNPAPNEYDVSPRRSSRNSSVSMKGDRRRTIDDGRETNSLFLVDKMSNENPGPGSYDSKSIFSDDSGTKMKGRRLGPFQTTSGHMHIRPEVDNKTKRPSPASYNIVKPTGKDAPSASFKGSRPKSLFGEPFRPGPGDYTLTTANMKKDPAYSVRQHTHPSYPESLNYVPKGHSDVPGPGNYQISRDVIENESPAYSMRQQLKSVEIEG